jgi:hypothetical protein
MFSAAPVYRARMGKGSASRFEVEGWAKESFRCPACGDVIVGGEHSPAGRIAKFRGRWMHRDCASEEQATGVRRVWYPDPRPG